MSAPFFRTQEHILPCQYIRQYPRATVNGDDDELQIVVKQYTPHDNPNPKVGDLTIIAAHANGVGKELYEPLWDELYRYSKQSSGFEIRAIWMADVAFQGASGVLNENKLGNDPSWYDHPRDLLHMINHFRHEMSRPFLGVGHSMGGNHIVNLSLLHPRLFHSLILVDPVIQREASTKGNFQPAYLSTLRRDIWPSRAEAAATFRRNKFYQSWDPRVLDLWIKHGLRELPTAIHPTYSPTSSKQSRAASLLSAAATSAAPVPPTSPTDKPVTLTTTKHQEVYTFVRGKYPAPGVSLSSYTPSRVTHPDVTLSASPTPDPFYRPEPLITFTMLPFLRPHCLYIFASDSVLSAPIHRQDKMSVTGTGMGGSGGAAEGAVKEIVVEDAGHFVPFEKPMLVAGEMGGWIEGEVGRWMAEEEWERREWAGVPVGERSKLSKEYEFWMKGTMKGTIDAANNAAARKSKL